MKKAVAALLLALAAAAPAAAEPFSSPYLASHAGDPVRWRAWGPEAIAEARRGDKLILVSLGYYACYWCGEMKRRTFADPVVARVLNRDVVPILVDREERPDLDAYFMAIKRAMDGRAGWPLNMFLTPDLVPLHGVNFLPPAPAEGQPGFADTAAALAGAWAAADGELRAGAAEIKRHLGALLAPQAAKDGRAPDAARTVALWRDRLDPAHGGFGRGAKFPEPVALGLLLDHAVQGGDAPLRDAVLDTLDRMAASGLRDQLGGLFFRYATDRFWQIPHFEIMLADNAQLARLYLAAYQAAGRPHHAAVAAGILDGLLARLRLPDGAFASALAARDANGEGAHYRWRRDEIAAVLGRDAPAFLADWLPAGAAEGILRYQGRPGPSAVLPPGPRARLLEARAARPAPPRDDKAVTAWNALAVSAFADAARILGRPDYLAVAAGLAERYTAADPRELRRNTLHGVASAAVMLDDYAFLVQALLDLYEADFDPRHLDAAARFAAVMLDRFGDGDGAPLAARPRDAARTLALPPMIEEDGAPSGNAAALAALGRLDLLGAGTGAAAERLRAALLAAAPVPPPGLARALAFRSEASREIIVAGKPGDPGTRAFLDVLRRHRAVGSVVAVVPPDGGGPVAGWAAFAARPMIGGRATAYVCVDRLCQEPTTEPDELARQLSGRTGRDQAGRQEPKGTTLLSASWPMSARPR